MSWWIIYANGHPFGVYADSFEAACNTAAVHIAAIIGTLQVLGLAAEELD